MEVGPEVPLNTDNLEKARKVRHGIRQAMEELDSALATAAAGREQAWSSGLLPRLNVLREAFDHHVQITEAPAGFLSEIVDRAPRLSHAVEKLRLEHVSIAEAFDHASSAVDLASQSPSAVEDARESVLELLQQLARHRQKGADVVFEAYDVEIEAGD